MKEGLRTPVVVHCSAGVGRSGVVILAEIMKACLEHNMVSTGPLHYMLPIIGFIKT